MRVAITGRNERMNCLYKDICSSYGCKAKVFTKLRDGMKPRLAIRI